MHLDRFVSWCCRRHCHPRRNSFTDSVAVPSWQEITTMLRLLLVTAASIGIVAAADLSGKWTRHDGNEW